VAKLSGKDSMIGPLGIRENCYQRMYVFSPFLSSVHGIQEFPLNVPVLIWQIGRTGFPGYQVMAIS
jgi:hypothetical protein